MGSAAQVKAMKQVAGKIKLDLAQYREMAAFSQFASDLDVTTQRLLARGERLTEVLKQNQFSPLSTAEQVLVIFTGVRGYLDKIATKDILRFEQDFLASFKRDKPKLFAEISAEKKISDELEKELSSYLENFVTVFA